MTLNGIRTNVQALLVDNDSFVTVLDAPPTGEDDFAGFPAAAHYMSDINSEYATVSQNRRTVEWNVELYLVTPSSVSASNQFQQMYTLVDAIIQMFDVTRDLSSTSLSLSPACMNLRAVPSRLERIDTKEGKGLMCTVSLFCEDDAWIAS